MTEISLFCLGLVARLFWFQTYCINPFLRGRNTLVYECCRKCLGYIFILAGLNRGFRFCFRLVNIYRRLFRFVRGYYRLLEVLFIWIHFNSLWNCSFWQLLAEGHFDNWILYFEVEFVILNWSSLKILCEKFCFATIFLKFLVFTDFSNKFY